MTPNDTISIAVILAMGSFIVALIGLVLNAKKQLKEDSTDKTKALEAENQRQLKLTENFVTVNLKLDAFSDSLNQMLAKSDKINEELRGMRDRSIENKMKIEDHDKRIKELELKVK